MSAVRNCLHEGGALTRVHVLFSAGTEEGKIPETPEEEMKWAEAPTLVDLFRGSERPMLL